MNSIADIASEKELKILRDHYQVPEIELTTAPASVDGTLLCTEVVTTGGWRITLYFAVEPTAEAPGTW